MKIARLKWEERIRTQSTVDSRQQTAPEKIEGQGGPVEEHEEKSFRR